SLVVLLPQVLRRRGKVVRVPEEFEQGLPRPGVAPCLVQRVRGAPQLPARPEKRVEFAEVLPDVRKELREVRLRSMPKDIVERFLVAGQPLVERFESGHLISPPR